MKKKSHLILFAVAFLFLTACNERAAENTAGDDNREEAMKSRFMTLNEAFNTGKLEAIDTLLSANSKDHSADTSMHMPDGPEGLKKTIAMLRTGSPDFKSDIKHVAVDDDILIAYGSMSGTNSGPMYGMPATNKKWSGNFCDVVKFDKDMKMSEHWGVYDEMKMMKDLGVIPSGPPPAAGSNPAAKN